MLVDSPKKDLIWAGSEAQQERLGLEDDNSNQVVYMCPGEIPCISHIHALCYWQSMYFLQLCLLVPLYLRLHWSIDYSLSYLSYLTFPTPSSYDYIIIGAGSAGLATFKLH